MIKEMIANRSKGAFERIKGYEKQALRIIPICIIAFVLMNMSVLIHGSNFGRVWVLLMVPVGAALWYWSYWLCGFLDKIDMSRMKVTEVLRYILKYKTYLVRHTVGAVLLLPVYMGVWLYCYASAQHDEFLEILTPEFVAIYLLILVVLCLVILWFRFFRHVQDIQRNLKELEEFEEEK
ncbi:hypothetical protein LJC38_01495 [Parabacteroides sp. OttesenSCG-928-K15]|nr:hypothetical protein [Parabacteroides sp. OttesenSCG-928-K15]